VCIDRGYMEMPTLPHSDPAYSSLSSTHNEPSVTSQAQDRVNSVPLYEGRTATCERLATNKDEYERLCNLQTDLDKVAYSALSNNNESKDRKYLSLLLEN